MKFNHFMIFLASIIFWFFWFVFLSRFLLLFKRVWLLGRFFIRGFIRFVLIFLRNFLFRSFFGVLFIWSFIFSSCFFVSRSFFFLFLLFNFFISFLKFIFFIFLIFSGFQDDFTVMFLQESISIWPGFKLAFPATDTSLYALSYAVIFHILAKDCKATALNAFLETDITCCKMMYSFLIRIFKNTLFFFTFKEKTVKIFQGFRGWLLHLYLLGTFLWANF